MFQVLTQNLEKLGYTVSCFNTAAEAAAYLDGAVDGQTVGFGGSVTLDQMGLYDTLGKHNTVHWHQKIADKAEGLEARRKAGAAAVYFSSVNGIAETGEIINIDGTGNRVSSIFYGHEKVFFIVGNNKIAPDYEAALHRARNIAAPLNAQRLGMKTPCAEKADRCYDCKSPQRICRGLSVLWGKPMACAFEVVLIDEPLGY
ncbi:MAG: lactate utilization protein [Clostridiales Family XIII bacterium]|nr:lactate utilization protein [Clostridiales Family XIII bacterium]